LAAPLRADSLAGLPPLCLALADCVDTREDLDAIRAEAKPAGRAALLP
jgi:hypothetical protein